MSEISGRLIQIGTVAGVNGTKARVFFQGTGMTSDWLYVLQRTGETVTVQTADGHTHKAEAGTWIPSIGDNVLVAYLPVSGADGFILGKI